MTEEFIDKEFISKVRDMVTDKYESELETISRGFTGHEKDQLLNHLNKWHKRMTAKLKDMREVSPWVGEKIKLEFVESDFLTRWPCDACGGAH